MSEYIYHLVPGDTKSKMFFLTKEELYKVEKELSDKVSTNYQNDRFGRREQAQAAKLISISYHILGGCIPITHRKSKSGIATYIVPHRYIQDYISYFIEAIVKFLYKFDRSKGCWTNYVRWAKGLAIERTIALERRCNKNESILNHNADVEMFCGSTMPHSTPDTSLLETFKFGLL